MAIKVYIDQGHNPSSYNTGAEGNGYFEQDITYRIGILLDGYFRSNSDFETRLSRPTPTTLLGTSNSSSLTARVNDANGWGADLFLSLHTNASVNPSANGSECLVYQYSAREANALAEDILEQMTLITGLRSRGVIERPGPAGILVSAFHEVKSNINVVIKSLEMLVAGKVSSRDISGPVGIFTVIGDSYSDAVQYGFKTVILTILDLILLLSANLGVMNLLPIPALDGGRLVFLLLEAGRGKPIDREKEGMVHFAGFVILMIIMVLVMFNDFARIAGY
jgi:membrane-associated protease RseP (regulator of RpoE activity)